MFFLLHIVRIHCLRSTVAQLAAVAFVRFIHYALRHDCSSVLWSYQLWPAIQLTRIPALNRSASIHKNKRGLVATKRFLISVTSVQAVSTSPSVRQCWYSLLHCIRRSLDSRLLPAAERSQRRSTMAGQTKSQTSAHALSSNTSSNNATEHQNSDNK